MRSKKEMPEFDIYTSQNVNLNYKLAGIGKRISAFALDAIILIAYSVVMIVVLTAIGFQEWPVFFVASIPVLLYDLVMEIFFNGQTIGKSASNIRVVKVNGLQPSVTDYLLRWIFRLIDITGTSGSLAVIFIAFTEKGQRLGDLAAGTTVVSLDKDTSLKELTPAGERKDYEPVFSEVLMLTDHEYRLLQKVINKYKQTFDKALINQMARQIKKKTGIETDLSDLKFLQTIMLDYEHYALKDKSLM